MAVSMNQLVPVAPFQKHLMLSGSADVLCSYCSSASDGGRLRKLLQVWKVLNANEKKSWSSDAKIAEGLFS